MKVFSTNHLPRDLKILGGIVLLFSLMVFAQNILLFIFFLSSAIVYFCLAVGVSRKERWAGYFGVVISGMSLLGFLFLIFTDIEAFLFSFLGILIISIIFISFIKFLKEEDLSKKVSIFPLILLLVAIGGSVVLEWYFSSDEYLQKQEQNRQENLTFELCRSLACRGSVVGEDGVPYYSHKDQKFTSRNECIKYCTELTFEEEEAIDDGLEEDY